MIINRQFPVVPSDTVDQLAGELFVIYVGGTGDVKVTAPHNEIITYKSVAAGFFHPFLVRRVWSTGTTGTFIIGGRD